MVLETVRSGEMVLLPDGKGGFTIDDGEGSVGSTPSDASGGGNLDDPGAKRGTKYPNSRSGKSKKSNNAKNSSMTKPAPKKTNSQSSLSGSQRRGSSGGVEVVAKASPTNSSVGRRRSLG